MRVVMIKIKIAVTTPAVATRPASIISRVPKIVNQATIRINTDLSKRGVGPPKTTPIIRMGKAKRNVFNTTFNNIALRVLSSSPGNIGD